MAVSSNRPSGVSRRAFLHTVLLAGGGVTLASCGPQATKAPPITPTPDATPTSDPRGARAIASDVLDFSLTSDAWPGAFGWVTFRLREASHDGEAVYYIRTDASDESFARESGLIWMPLLIAGDDGEFENRLYVFDDNRPPLMRSVPGQEAFLSLFEIVGVKGAQDREFRSATALVAAAEAGEVHLEESGIYVNYPVVKWPGDELPVDAARDSYLGTGQLLEPIDFEHMTVTLKLHEGFPGSYYILTDTSAIDWADEMHIAPSASSWNTTKYDATDEVFVFANGIPGSGVMGYQPAVFGSSVESRVSSPFWNHFTVRWRYEENARVLRDSGEVYDAIERGELEKLNGLPETHPNGFVVNCPVPVLADNSS